MQKAECARHKAQGRGLGWGALAVIDGEVRCTLGGLPP